MKQTTEIPTQNDEVVVTFLNLLLADEYVLYTKTRTAHWNVDGSNHFEMHVFLENQYNALDDIIDNLAERIRSLGHFALGSLKDFLSIVQMSDDYHNFSNPQQIFETLISDHEAIIGIIQHELFAISVNLKDIGTAKFLAGLLKRHKKMTWMLRSFLSESVIGATSLISTSTSQLADRQD